MMDEEYERMMEEAECKMDDGYYGMDGMMDEC